MSEPVFRPIEPRDDVAVAAIIREVMPQFGADGPGFALHDPEVDAMYAAYQGERHLYLVVEVEGEVRGGGGYAPLRGGPSGVCELQKMYFLPDLRGKGVGAALLGTLLARARQDGCRGCYLETLVGMKAAQALYRRTGFIPLSAPLGRTGHHGCDRWFYLDFGLGGGEPSPT